MTKKIPDESLKRHHAKFRSGEKVRLYRPDYSIPMGDILTVDGFESKSGKFTSVITADSFFFWVRTCCLARVKE